MEADMVGATRVHHIHKTSRSPPILQLIPALQATPTPLTRAHYRLMKYHSTSSTPCPSTTNPQKLVHRRHLRFLLFPMINFPIRGALRPDLVALRSMVDQVLVLHRLWILTSIISAKAGKPWNTNVILSNLRLQNFNRSAPSCAEDRPQVPIPNTLLHHSPQTFNPHGTPEQMLVSVIYVLLIALETPCALGMIPGESAAPTRHEMHPLVT